MGSLKCGAENETWKASRWVGNGVGCGGVSTPQPTRRSGVRRRSPAGYGHAFGHFFECHSTIIMKFELYERHLELFELLSCENEVKKGQ